MLGTMPWREILASAAILAGILCFMAAVILIATSAAAKLERWADRKDQEAYDRRGGGQ